MTRHVDKNPEQIARDRIDDRLRVADWDAQDRNAIDFKAGLGIAVREYQTAVGPADYLLFADTRPVGVVESGGSRRWVQRIVIQGKRRDLGLGSYPLVFAVERRRRGVARLPQACTAHDRATPDLLPRPRPTRTDGLDCHLESRDALPA